MNRYQWEDSDIVFDDDGTLSKHLPGQHDQKDHGHRDGNGEDDKNIPPLYHGTLAVIRPGQRLRTNATGFAFATASKEQALAWARNQAQTLERLGQEAPEVHVYEIEPLEEPTDMSGLSTAFSSTWGFKRGKGKVVRELTEDDLGEALERVKWVEDRDKVLRAKALAERALNELPSARSVERGMEPDFDSEIPALLSPHRFGLPKKGAPNSVEAAEYVYDEGDDLRETPALGMVAYDDDGNPVGTLNAAVGGSDAGAVKITVREDAQKQGIGMRLLDEAYAAGYDISRHIRDNSFTPGGRRLVEKWLRTKIDSSLDKSRIYVGHPSEAPPGVQLEQGPRGGVYYEGQPGQPGQTELAPPTTEEMPEQEETKYHELDLNEFAYYLNYQGLRQGVADYFGDMGLDYKRIFKRWAESFSGMEEVRGEAVSYLTGDGNPNSDGAKMVRIIDAAPTFAESRAPGERRLQRGMSFLNTSDGMHIVAEDWKVGKEINLSLASFTTDPMRVGQFIDPDTQIYARAEMEATQNKKRRREELIRELEIEAEAEIEDGVDEEDRIVIDDDLIDMLMEEREEQYEDEAYEIADSLRDEFYGEGYGIVINLSDDSKAVHIDAISGMMQSEWVTQGRFVIEESRISDHITEEIETDSFDSDYPFPILVVSLRQIETFGEPDTSRTIDRSFDEDMFIRKHLPGEHDQSDHGNRDINTDIQIVVEPEDAHFISPDGDFITVNADSLPPHHLGPFGSVPHYAVAGAILGMDDDPRAEDELVKHGYIRVGNTKNTFEKKAAYLQFNEDYSPEQMAAMRRYVAATNPDSVVIEFGDHDMVRASEPRMIWSELRQAMIRRRARRSTLAKAEGNWIDAFLSSIGKAGRGPGGEGTVGYGSDITSEARFGTEADHERHSTQGEREVEVRRGPGLFSKARKYLKPGENPPKGVEVQVGSRGGRYYETGTRPDDPHWATDFPKWARPYETISFGYSIKEWNEFLSRADQRIDKLEREERVEAERYTAAPYVEERAKAAFRVELSGMLEEADVIVNKKDWGHYEKSSSLAFMIRAANRLEEMGVDVLDHMPATFMRMMGWQSISDAARSGDPMASVIRAQYSNSTPHNPHDMAKVVKAIRKELQSLWEYPAFHIYPINYVSEFEANAIGEVFHAWTGLSGSRISIALKTENGINQATRWDKPYKSDEFGEYRTTASFSYQHIVTHELMHTIATPSFRKSVERQKDFLDVMERNGIGIDSLGYRQTIGEYGMNDPHEAVAEVGAHVILHPGTLPKEVEDWYRHNILLDYVQVGPDGDYEYNGRRYRRREFPA